MEEAEVLCDRLAIMDHGRILEMGTVDELISGKRFKASYRGGGGREREREGGREKQGGGGGGKKKKSLKRSKRR